MMLCYIFICVCIKSNCFLCVLLVCAIQVHRSITFCGNASCKYHQTVRHNLIFIVFPMVCAVRIGNCVHGKDWKFFFCFSNGCGNVSTNLPLIILIRWVSKAQVLDHISGANLLMYVLFHTNHQTCWHTMRKQNKSKIIHFHYKRCAHNKQKHWKCVDGKWAKWLE